MDCKLFLLPHSLIDTSRLLDFTHEPITSLYNLIIQARKKTKYVFQKNHLVGLRFCQSPTQVQTLKHSHFIHWSFLRENFNLIIQMHWSVYAVALDVPCLLFNTGCLKRAC